MWILLVSLAQAQAVDFTCTPARSSGEVLGVPPIAVTCTLEVSDLYTYERAEWLMGDGTVLEGDEVSYLYEEPGQFDVQVFLDGLAYSVGDTGEPDVDPSVVKRGMVTACAPPEVEFTYLFKGGLTYQLFNHSDFIPGCVDTIRWAVHEGEGRSAQPLLVADTWEARFELPDDGTYTFFLDMGGIAGAGAAKLSVDARYGLTDELENGSVACATGGGAAGWLVLPTMALLWGRRRR